MKKNIVTFTCCILIFAILQFVCVSGEKMRFPRGHLEPFGGHTPPDLIEERQDFPSAQEFWEKYVSISKPVIFRGAGQHSPIFHKWTDQYLLENFGDLELRIEGILEKSGNIPAGTKGVGRDTLDHFVKTYHDSGSNKYVVSELPSPMYKDYMVPPFLGCGTFAKRIVEVDIWLSGGGSKSILHKDAFNQLNCLFNGTKKWKFVEHKYEDKIYKAWEPSEEIGGFSRINPEKVDLLKYPSVSQVPWSYAELRRGDCLFLPKSMYHQVDSFGTNNLAVSLLFSRFDNMTNLNLSDCSQQFRPLSDFETDWCYSGYGKMSMGNLDLEYGLRTNLLKLAEKTPISAKRMLRYIKFLMKMSGETKQNKTWLIGAVKKMWNILGLKIKDALSVENIRSLSKNQLRTIALAVARVEPSNLYEHELYLIKGEDIESLVIRLMSQGSLEKDKFIESYVNILSGSVPFGEKLYKDLGGEGRMSISKETVLERLKSAVLPYLEKTTEPSEEEDEGRSNDAYDKRMEPVIQPDNGNTPMPKDIDGETGEVSGGDKAKISVESSEGAVAGEDKSESHDETDKFGNSYISNSNKEEDLSAKVQHNKDEL